MHALTRDLHRDAVYKLMSGSVVPRPIAWVTTLNEQGRVNLAPFSAFTYVSIEPPMLGFHCVRKAGARKDTLNNARAIGDFVVHIADTSLVRAVHESSEEHPAEVSEAELLGLATAPSLVVRTPRLAEVPIALECRFHEAIPFGVGGSELVVGEVVAFHVRDALLRDGKIETVALDPIARLGGPNYARLGEVISLRPIASSPKSLPRDSGLGTDASRAESP
jgi:flavin reductase (DIM6/NTAB) family NADH-FMN oxidoreductase RutF